MYRSTFLFLLLTSGLCFGGDGVEESVLNTEQDETHDYSDDAGGDAEGEEGLGPSAGSGVIDVVVFDEEDDQRTKKNV